MSERKKPSSPLFLGKHCEVCDCAASGVFDKKEVMRSWFSEGNTEQVE